MDLNELSEQLLLRVKQQRPTDQLREKLSTMPFSKVLDTLPTDTQKKAFWINIYNAYFQILRRDQQVGKPHIYRDKRVSIAGKDFSLDDIEHGILRKYRLKWSLGYLPNLLAPALIKRLAVKKLDYRIHFALNCGAKSCPPIAFYAPGQLDRQLELATLAFLEAETEILPEQQEIHLTRLFQWYSGDFGGQPGIRKILQEKLNIDAREQKILFKDYDWQEQLDNFIELV